MSKDLYVIAEQRDGEIAKVTLELLGEATILAADLGEKVYAVLLGDQINQCCRNNHRQRQNNCQYTCYDPFFLTCHFHHNFIHSIILP